MTTVPPKSGKTAPGAVPPPGCPAHGPGSDSLVNLFATENHSDPAGLYEQLRKEHGAVAPVLLAGDVPAWLVLGYRENLDVTRTPARFSRDSRIWRELKEGRVPPDSPIMPVIAWQPVCVYADGEEHERLRAAVTESLGRLDRRGIRQHVTRFANQLIDEFQGDGHAELVQQFADHLPMLVLTRLFGMPEEYGPRLVDACRDLVKGSETAVASNEYVTEACRRLVERKRGDQGQDFATWLLGHPSRLTEDELVQHLWLVLISANETTCNLIVNTLRTVLTDRRFRASLAGGHMTLPDAVEQVLWDEPPLKVVPARWATGDTELGDQHIRDGDMLLLGLAAGNTDPAIRPDLNAPMHGNRAHLAFSSGPHECPGQDIGRAIADTAIDTLLMRLPDLQLAVDETELEWITSWISHHLVALPVKFAERSSVPEAGAAEDSDAGNAPAAPHTPPAGDPGPAGTGTPADPAAAGGPPPARMSVWEALTNWLRGR